VRYASADAPGHIKYGEPIIGEADVDNIAELARLGYLEVRVLEGSDALSAKPTGLRENVGKLFGPLAASEVPIVRCIGLNYKTHSEHAGWRRHTQH
jgi:hypothetical protein